MGTEIKDKATAELAALNLNKGTESSGQEGETRPPRKKSTSEVLFPENISDDGIIVNQPIRPIEGLEENFPQGPSTPTVQPPASTPEAPAPTVPSYLDLSKLPDNTMVRMKVDGVEMDVPAKDALKNMQLERHLTLKAQQLAEREKQLEIEREFYKQQALAKPKNADKAPEKNVERPSNAPIESDEVLALKAELQELRKTIAPQLFDSSLKKLEMRVKENLGADDFMTFVPKIKEFVDGELRKPEIAANPNAISALDSQEFWYSKYQELKLKALMSGEKPSTPPPPAPQKQTPPTTHIVTNPVEYPHGTIPILDRSGEVRPMPFVEGSNGVPNRTTPDANWQARYKEAFDRAQKEKTNEAWQAVFKLKRESSDQ